MSTTPPPQYPGAPAPQYQAGPAAAAAPAPRRRGLKRIIFGSLGLVANAVGLLLVPFLTAIIGAVIAMNGATAVSAGAPGAEVTAKSLDLVYVYAPATEAENAQCTASGAGATFEPSVADGGFSKTVNGAEYVEIGSVTPARAGQVQVLCEGVSDIAIATVGVGGFLGTSLLSFSIPIVLGLVSLGLLIWGIIARVRSGKAAQRF
ncbi:hypothetical protein JSY14_04760 [Brachybacterium sp. EF45031]|uniref:hypothetical protein n=1 Tax=Brachybacterium sillae TaxID=2810536 RepID=UPI00217EF85B|nr:hypothetical protein [Brachybacterium sillae]MCS6711362.1 hypothetical protein [Brachybacterium sillae]